MAGGLRRSIRSASRWATAWATAASSPSRRCGRSGDFTAGAFRGATTASNASWGGFGIDLEFQQQGFSFATNASQVEEKKDYLYYTRHVNSVVLPIVWQPHFYMLRNHVRIYLEAAATFSYNISSTYENEQARANGSAGWKGDYPFKLARDNRWGYGLAGGGGIAFLIRRFELNFRVRYSFGYSDIVRNRNKYYDNNSDGAENPFWATPLRSPLDNLMISVGLNYRFNKQGFEAWKPRPKKEKNREVFKFGL
ncbi:MAG: outer membrane beta-barrel protein [Alistipes shahii]|uniref:outer membrane beta-barrel protein n=1 Tax=Alistipes shahii TaxID=328814 RepID=UPI00399CDC0D